MELNIKDILSKLSVFRNKSLLIPIIIFLIGMLLFIPTQLMSSGLKEQVQKESVSDGYNRVKNLLKNPVSDEELKNKENQLDTRVKDANQIILLAKQTTQRQLLSDNIFDVNDPNSLPGLVFLQFGKKFTGGIDQMVAEAKASDCPTEAEMNREIDKSGVKSRSMMGMGMDGMYDSRNMMTTRPGSRRRGPMSRGMGLLTGPGMKSELEMVVIEQLCRKRAEEIAFYITPARLVHYHGRSSWK